MKDNKPRYTLRVEYELLRKFEYVAKHNARTINRELEFLMTKRVSDYEKKYEKIPEEIYKRDSEENGNQK